MHRIQRSTLVRLLALALVLPPAQGVLFWVERLLRAMQDVEGANWVARLILLLGAIWLVDLVLLILALGVNASADSDGQDSPDKRD